MKSRPKTLSQEPTRSRVAKMYRTGMTARQIALALGISTQRVYQHLKKLRESGELSRKATA